MGKITASHSSAVSALIIPAARTVPVAGATTVVCINIADKSLPPTKKSQISKKTA